METLMPKPRFAEQLELLRRKKGLTQKALAAEMGVTESVISTAESGKRIPAMPTLQRMAPVLGVTYEELVEMAYGEKPTEKPKLVARLVRPLDPEDPRSVEAREILSLLSERRQADWIAIGNELLKQDERDLDQVD